ncbi:hypothetical protein N7530_001612 [Penicillium desertorum]|uniref:aldehyde dehydrogenase (NAD(+)) n=1 Tax=Penicillium desertorum TaxID=1303715 RepID=A0A9W9XAK1_9EURO|nr:hypothetical protein N7530_001612 [Penicillium desertorum]
MTTDVGGSNKTFEVVYPYTKEVVAQIQEANIEDVEDAVTASSTAFPAWRDLGTDKRGAYLRKLSQLILESNNELTKLETLCTTDFTPLHVAKLIEKVGFPPGVVNIISGFGNPTGAALASHMAVRSAKSNMKDVHMELGGKSPVIIFEVADLETAVAQTQFGIQFNSRQIDLLRYNRIKEYLAIGEKDGMLRLGDDASNGFFVRPTIFEGVGEDSRLMREELFGPVVAINTIFTETEAIEKANNSALGLYAAVFIKDLDRAVRLAKALDAGTVGVNCTSPTNARDTAFGGFKMSGTVREGFCIVLTISLRVS